MAIDLDALTNELESNGYIVLRPFNRVGIRVYAEDAGAMLFYVEASGRIVITRDGYAHPTIERIFTRHFRSES